MLDAKQILDALVGAAAIDPQGREPAGAGRDAGAAGGGIGDLLGKVLGGGQGSAPETGQEMSRGGGLPGGLGDLLGGVFGGSSQGGEAGAGAGSGPAGGLLKQAMDFAQTPKGAAIIAGLAGLMLNKAGRTVSGSAARLGGAALVGGLAYKAMQEWRRGAAPEQPQSAAPEPAPASTPYAADSLSNEQALALVQAMIAAAAADGQVDADERSRITGALGAALPAEAAQFLDSAFARPLTPAQLADLATGPEHAAQIYVAARIAIDPDTPAEQAFLSSLQHELGLDDGLVERLDAAALSARA